MDAVQERRRQFDYLHKDKGGINKLCQLLEDYTFSYNAIAQYFGFSSGSTYIAHLIHRLALDSRRGYLTLQDRRNNFNQIYGAQGGVTKLLKMLKAQASDKEIAQQFGIDENRVGQALRRLGLHRRDFRIKHQLSPQEYFDQRYQKQGGIARLIQMAQDPRVSLADIAEHFGYAGSSGVLRALKRMGLKYVSKDLINLTARRLNFDKKHQSKGGLKMLETMLSDDASTKSIAQHFGLSCSGVRHAIQRLFPEGVKRNT